MTAMGLTGLNLPYGEPLTLEDFDRIPWAGAKFELIAGSLVVSEGNFTIADLDDVPDDGHRYELLGGVLVVSPAPSLMHQRVSRRLHQLLQSAAPIDCDAPTDVVLPAPDVTRVQPDLVVGRAVDISAKRFDEAPLLVVEILSPSTRATDRDFKKAIFAQGGCPHYWIVDADDPSVVAWELVDGEYVEVGRARAEETLTLEQPFPVTVTPQRLIER